MPDHLLRELNPMTITVNSAGGLPSTPVPHEELRERCVCVNHISGELSGELFTSYLTVPLSPPPNTHRCEPVYVKYHFFSQPWHRTVSLPHSPHIGWEDSHVILLGTLDQQQLVEYLR